MLSAQYVEYKNTNYCDFQSSLVVFTSSLFHPTITGAITDFKLI